jgi:hypothetical protein
MVTFFEHFSGCFIAKSDPKLFAAIATSRKVYISTVVSFSTSLQKICVSGFWGIEQNTVHKWGPTFHLFREEAPHVGDVAHITICLAKNLQILGGDKNGLHCICLG